MRFGSAVACATAAPKRRHDTCLRGAAMACIVVAMASMAAPRIAAPRRTPSRHRIATPPALLRCVIEAAPAMRAITAPRHTPCQRHDGADRGRLARMAATRYTPSWRHDSAHRDHYGAHDGAAAAPRYKATVRAIAAPRWRVSWQHYGPSRRRHTRHGEAAITYSVAPLARMRSTMHGIAAPRWRVSTPPHVPKRPRCARF